MSETLARELREYVNGQQSFSGKLEALREVSDYLLKLQQSIAAEVRQRVEDER